MLDAVWFYIRPHMRRHIWRLCRTTWQPGSAGSTCLPRGASWQHWPRICPQATPHWAPQPTAWCWTASCWPLQTTRACLHCSTSGRRPCTHCQLSLRPSCRGMDCWVGIEGSVSSKEAAYSSSVLAAICRCKRPACCSSMLAVSLNETLSASACQQSRHADPDGRAETRLLSQGFWHVGCSGQAGSL